MPQALEAGNVDCEIHCREIDGPHQSLASAKSFVDTWKPCLDDHDHDEDEEADENAE